MNEVAQCQDWKDRAKTTRTVIRNFTLIVSYPIAFKLTSRYVRRIVKETITREVVEVE